MFLRMVGEYRPGTCEECVNQNPEVDTDSLESSSGLYDSKVDALPHDHGQYQPIYAGNEYNYTIPTFPEDLIPFQMQA